MRRVDLLRDFGSLIFVISVASVFVIAIYLIFLVLFLIVFVVNGDAIGN